MKPICLECGKEIRRDGWSKNAVVCHHVWRCGCEADLLHLGRMLLEIMEQTPSDPLDAVAAKPENTQ